LVVSGEAWALRQKTGFTVFKFTRMNKRKIVYAICVEDIYRTAKDIDQELTEQEVSE